MNRNGLTGNLAQATSSLWYGCFGQIDNLTYNYDPANGNKLQSITDAVTGTIGKKGFAQTVTGDAYYYDANGNMTYDRNKSMSIEYNYLNLPARITFTREVTSGGMTSTFTRGIIEFMYSASGVKLQKKVDVYDLGGGYVSSTITNYSNGAEYDGSNNLVRLQHTEGAIAKNASGSFVYEYSLKDHLGNTRVTFSDNIDDNDNVNSNNGIISSSEIKQINHYYPFGLNMEGPGFGTVHNNKYEYNGKELNTDFGLNWNDYGKRWYDPTVGRFPSVDPIIEKFAHATPYNYAENSPIANIDLWGLQKYHFTRLQNSDGSSYLKLSGVSNFYKTEAISFHPFRSSGYYTYETKVNNDHQEYEVTQQLVKGEYNRLNNDFFGITNDITKTYKTLEDAVNAPDSDFKLSKSKSFFENLIGYGSLGMSSEFNEVKIVFRGGSSMVARSIDVAIDPITKLVKTTRGISVHLDPKVVEKFGGAYEIKNLPKDLQLIQRGKDLNHFEIVPKYQMSIEKYQELLNQIEISKVKK